MVLNKITTKLLSFGVATIFAVTRPQAQRRTPFSGLHIPFAPLVMLEQYSRMGLLFLLSTLITLGVMATQRFMSTSAR